ncbi:MAG: hypothetical protein ACRBBP_03325, partial [Bdellovibrionales bacterium]
MQSFKVLGLLVLLLGANTALASEAFSFQGLWDKSYFNFGTMCYSYSADLPTSPDTFKCRRYGDSLFVDGLIEGVLYDEMNLWGKGGDYNFPGQVPLKKLHLNSKGGIMFDHKGGAVTAVDIIELVKEKELETYAGAECKSACVPIFVGGLKRQARADSSFMVHNPRLGGAHLIFLRNKCGENLDATECREEIAEIRANQIVDMDLYFDLLEYDGVSMNLRNDYLAGAKDE